MFNGAVDRYDWELVGKEEMYVPYNSYKLHSDTVKIKDILTPLHINPDVTRYELHRVWVVDATLREGARHIYKRRTFYVDEDSWQIVAMDQYDNRDQLWLEVHIDLQAGRYLAIGLDNESAMYRFGIDRTMEDFTPAALRRAGVR